MPAGFHLSSDATAQLGALVEFIAFENPDAADRVWTALMDACELLAEAPGIGHTRAELTSKPLKFWRVYSYLVVYAPESDPVEIVAILHGARDIGSILHGDAATP